MIFKVHEDRVGFAHQWFYYEIEAESKEDAMRQIEGSYAHASLIDVGPVEFTGWEQESTYECEVD
jgi:hypothetical protein